MINLIKSLFKPTVVQVTNIQDLFPFYDSDKFVIGVKKGSLDPINSQRLAEGKQFEFNGCAGDFVILPKSTMEESS